MHHSAFTRPIDQLDVVLIDDSEPMLSILRTILKAFGVSRQRTYTCPQHALTEMIAEPPNLILTDWCMAPVSGLELVRCLRRRDLAPLCFTSVMVVSGHASREQVINAYCAGAHDFIVKPISPQFLHGRLKRLQDDTRQYTLLGDHYAIEGVEETVRRLDPRHSATLDA